MTERQYTRRQMSGFTIVELLVVIVVIAILAMVAIVSYRGVQSRAVVSLLDSDLRSSQKAIELHYVQNERYPAVIPSEMASSDKVDLRLVQGGQEVYSGLSAAQNGVLFFDTCQKLIAEGAGSRPSDGSAYISACSVSSYNQIHVNGWNGRNINVPVTAASLANYVNSYSGGSVAEFKEKAQIFMDTWVARFQAAGGSLPVTEFWDSWATPVNGGRLKPTLPPPVTSGGGDSYCIQAAYQDSAVVRHLNKDGPVVDGPC